MQNRQYVSSFSIFVFENFNELPSFVKRLKNVNGHKEIDVNSIFKQKFSQKLRNKWKQLEEKYYANGGRKKYGGDFVKTGIEEVEIDVKDIVPGQIGVEGSSLLNGLNGGEHTPSSVLPHALKLIDNGKPVVLLTDGTHRVAIAILKGETKVKLYLKVKDFV